MRNPNHPPTPATHRPPGPSGAAGHSARAKLKVALFAGAAVWLALLAIAGLAR